MFVVETSSNGAEILCRIVPIANDRFVRFLFGISEVESTDLALRLVVKALERDIFARYPVGPDKDRRLFSQRRRVSSESEWEWGNRDAIRFGPPTTVNWSR